MWRDIRSALILAAVTGALYGLGMLAGPLRWNLGDDAHALLLRIGIVLTLVGFVAEFVASGLRRKVDDGEG